MLSDLSATHAGQTSNKIIGCIKTVLLGFIALKSLNLFPDIRFLKEDIKLSFSAA